jgi:hypothetical protein
MYTAAQMGAHPGYSSRRCGTNDAVLALQERWAAMPLALAGRDGEADRLSRAPGQHKAWFSGTGEGIRCAGG